MKKIGLNYDFINEHDDEVLIHNKLIQMLYAVKNLGSLSAAAREIGVSYRHAWGELNRWEQELGQPLLDRGRGQSGQLTSFALKLLWAEKDVQARFASEITALRASLEQAFAMAMESEVFVMTLAGCPDEAISLLREKAIEQRLFLEVDFDSSQEGLLRLQCGDCSVAGFNFPAGSDLNSLSAKTFRTLLDPSKQMLIGFASRTQGLVVNVGNPLRLYSLLDVSRRKSRYVNRAEGTGTRVLLEELLRSSGLKSSELNGYDQEVASHAAVATQVASGRADAGLCIESVARKMRLDFVPLVRENYYLVCSMEFGQSEPMKALCKFLQSSPWREVCNALPGYDASQAGTLLDMREHLGWWKE